MRISPDQASGRIHFYIHGHRDMVRQGVSRADYAIKFLFNYKATVRGIGAFSVRSIYTNIPALLTPESLESLRTELARESCHTNPVINIKRAVEMVLPPGKYDVGVLARDNSNDWSPHGILSYDIFIIPAESRNTHFVDRLTDVVRREQQQRNQLRSYR